ncbi:uncharacterized protein [Linepithema humile]|uniref:uncharacterized protein n=1 Tax=Linepithema humile TaxID=83485 RepID=UPI00351F08D3
MEQLKGFLANRYQILEAVQQRKDNNAKSQANSSIKQKSEHLTSHLSVQNKGNCPMCQEDHRIYQCQKIRDLSVQARINEVKRLNLCLNCLGKGHTVKSCKAGNCKRCSGKHNSLLHIEELSDISSKADASRPNHSRKDGKAKEETSSLSEPQLVQAITTYSVKQPAQVLLSTAIVYIDDNVGNKIEARALLDNGSQSNFISSSLCDRLKLPKRKFNQSVGAIAQAVTRISAATTVTIRSRFNAFSITLSFSMLDEITNNIPLMPFDVQSVKIPKHVILADPSYCIPQKIDLLLGAGTKLGWIIGGPYAVKPRQTTIQEFCGFSDANYLQDQLQRFWKIDEVPTSQVQSQEELACEKHFQQTHRRLFSGRFQVRLPLRENPDQLGESYDIAFKRLRSIERKFIKDPLIKERYTTFMKDYESLNHMGRGEMNEKGIPANYLPHHAVLKEESATTKLRVVFDASSHTTSGKSLNDILMVGPVIQDELIDIVARFRQHAYVMTADITKMYRQISVDERDRDLQRILWRTDIHATPTIYRLNTLTYGTGPASFLATRCLLQLAIENATKFPEASEETKILGLRWSADNDQLVYKIHLTGQEQRPTKRTILSFVAQLFDPLGLIGPTTIKAKIIIQQLWQLKVGWDEGLPMNLHTKWMKYKQNFARINEIKIPRHVLCNNPIRVELHGFCDASMSAYGACIYLKSTEPLGATSVRLLCAKSRVAPLKAITLPRLELCGALLLSRLYKKMKTALTIEIHREIFWCDSSVALSWIRGQPYQWKEFVRNRVSEIQDATEKNHWRHVRSEHNPADIISRGSDPQQLINASIWWYGPEWLKKDEELWPISSYPPVHEIPETKAYSLAFPVVPISYELFLKYSSLRKLQRIVAYVFRFQTNAKAANARGERQIGDLTVEELQHSMKALVMLAQQQAFPQEINDLRSTSTVSSRSNLLDLHPFIDEDDIVRVGGRLQNAPLPYKRRFPMVLPQKHPLTKLIILHFHHRDLHAGSLALLAAIREQYWIIAARSAIRSVLRKCVTCFRRQPISPTQLMGNLPAERITPSRPFSNVGVDYAGPYTIKISRNKTSKAYLCLSICLATKAVHFEIVSDLTTAGFLNALKRFISRRGRCKTIISDNGTNFVGANNTLQQLGNLIKGATHQEEIVRFSADQSIEWKFIPPHLPHVGGLWESAVKSAKTHAKAVIGETSLSFEELCTVFCQIEACLNSRPLSPLSSDPCNFEVLTPGHFLVGSSLTSLPEEDISNVALNRLNRYELLTKMQQDFWHRWSREYLAQLQQRTKWKTKKVNEEIKVGALVLIRESTPPLKWSLGRIIDVHPGKDGLIRTVTLKTQGGIIQRTLPKICVMPIDTF